MLILSLGVFLSLVVFPVCPLLAILIFIAFIYVCVPVPVCECICVCVCVCVCVFAIALMWMPKYNLCESVVSFHRGSPSPED